MNSPTHRAAVDAEGNIILPGAGNRVSEKTVFIEEEGDMKEGVWYESAPEPSFAWDTTGEEEIETEVVMTEEIIEDEVAADEAAALGARVLETTNEVWNTVRTNVYRVTNDTVHEGMRQYRASVEDAGIAGVEAVQSTTSAIRRTWSFLTQPVWVPGRNKKPVQHGRGVLFLLDTVRFGGTFATLFSVLFVGLNYQSFWAIAESYVDPLAQVTGIKADDSGLDDDVADKLKKIPSLAVAGQTDGGMIDFLPLVGPPDNRLIIPKLNLNVPIVIPPTDALIAEDWKKLEEEIQAGLQDGVVHYPGTARPGQAGNFFVTGHSSYFPWAPGAYKSVFARLHELNVGDEYWVFYNGDKHRYVIQEEKEIKPSDVTVLDQPVGKRIGTLMTCTPVGTTLRRLILVSQEVDAVTGLALDVGERTHEEALPQMKLDLLPI